MSFRSSLIATIVVIVALLLLSTVAAVGEVLDRSARQDLGVRLGRGSEVLRELWDLSVRLHGSQAAVVAEEPRLKAVVGTEDITHETVIGVAQELNRDIRADIFLVADRDATLLADVYHPGEHGHPISTLPGVADAMENGRASAVWVDEEGVYQVEVREISLGTVSYGLLVLGWELDRAWVESAARQTGAHVVLMRDGAVIAASEESLAAHAESLAGVTSSRPRELGVGGARHLAARSDLATRFGRDDVHHVLLTSLDEALEPSRELKSILYAIAGVALLMGVVLALALSQWLSRPLRGLVTFARRVGEDDLTARADAGGAREIQTLAHAMNNMVAELFRGREQLAAKERLDREMEIANQLQIAMLPGDLSASPLAIAARMKPATEVGGDYYDILPTGESRCWIGIGDVAGHGLPAGIVMMMVQTAISAIVRGDHDLAPSEVLLRLNDIVYENVRRRLRGSEHVTLCLLKHEGDGRVRYAGAHEDMLHWRAASGTFDWIATSGTWMGIVDRVEHVLDDRELQLADGDLLVLITDGVLEAANEEDVLFGPERLRETIASVRDLENAPVAHIADQVMSRVDEWLVTREDDVTVVVVRYREAREAV